MTNKKPTINIGDDDFGLVLNAAVRYSIGRQTYMPGAVIDFITPLLPYLNNRTIHVLDQDIVDANFFGGYGDETIDKPLWMNFLNKVRDEKTKRGLEPYKSWREIYEE